MRKRNVLASQSTEKHAIVSPNAHDKIAIDWDHELPDESVITLNCLYGALSWCGEYKTAEEVIDEVATDQPFYINSGGGITLSGGEALLQPEFATEILSGCKQIGISTAIETAGNVPWENMAHVLPFVDVMIHDIKFMDPDKHKTWTGVDNLRILENYQKAYESFPKIQYLVRTPIIPGINDDLDELGKIIQFVKENSKNVRMSYEPLMYHQLGIGKYEMIGKDYELMATRPFEDDVWLKLNEKINLMLQP